MKYRHNKSGMVYTFLTTAARENDQLECVVYQCDVTSKRWIRPAL